MSTETQTALVAQLQTTGFQSKKFVMILLGLACVMIIFFAAITAMMWKPEIASFVSPLASIVVPSIAGFVAVYAGAAAYTDGKTTDGIAKASG